MNSKLWLVPVVLLLGAGIGELILRLLEQQNQTNQTNNSESRWWPW